ncbi:hypothetical protein BX600DRAFT_552571 [Xylariales sp. PMI_506]|nr:hypothetical protein BX600DRAFT_552571 [Xylariales sp. PMI_506]
MDPASILGVASSAIQIVDFSSKVLSRIRALYKTGRNASEDFEAIHDDALRLRRLNAGLSSLLTAKDLSRDLTAGEDQIVELCSECDSAADDLLKALERFSIQEKDECSSSESEPVPIQGKGGKRAFLTHGKQRNLQKRRKAFFEREWSAIQTAVREVWVRKGVDRLHQRVETTRHALADSILINMQQEILRSAIQAANPSTHPLKWGGAKTVSEWLQSDMPTTDQCREQLIEVLNETNMYIEADNFRQLEAWSTSPMSQSLVEGVIRSLSFDAMSSRENSITPAFAATFQWIYSEAHAQDRPWDNFASWLAGDGQGVYWISGKAGSGKSTLMKLLFRQPQTRDCLSQWVGQDSLVQAGFFSWNSGIPLQKSPHGLLRSLLHQSISQRLKIPHGTFRNKLEAFQLSRLSAQRTQWQWQDLLQATRLLVEEDAAVKYIFFIDGLDEFDGDLSVLVSLVHTLGSYPNVKVCVSSRPWIVFEDAFKRQPSLILQHLTYDDIRSYAYENLTKTTAFREMSWGKPKAASTLVRTITTKASGVFLWVVLVVKSLHEGLADGDRLAELEARLEEMPEELGDLFKKILHGLQGKYFHDAARLFRIQQASTSVGDSTPTLLTMSFADQGDLESCKAWPAETLSSKELFVMATRMNRRLNSRCKGLLEAVPSQSSRQGIIIWNSRDLDTIITESASGNHLKIDQLNKYGQALANCEIQYLHRTVKDYLELPEISELMETELAGDLHPLASLGVAGLMELKTMETITSSSARRTLHKSLEALFGFAARLSICNKREYIDLLESTRIVTGQIAHRKFQDGLTIGQSISSLSPGVGEWPCTAKTVDNTSEFLALAVRSHFVTYVETKLRSKPATRTELSRLLRLAVSVRGSRDFALPEIDKPRTRSPNKLAPEPEMVRVLLTFGADPDYLVHGTSSIQAINNWTSGPGSDRLPVLDEILEMLGRHSKLKSRGIHLGLKAKRDN